MIRSGIGRAVLLVAVLSFGPLALLTYSSTKLATEAVEVEVQGRLEAMAGLTAHVVDDELAGLIQLVESYAERPTLVAAVRATPGDERDRAIQFHLEALRAARPGIPVAFVARPDGVLQGITPPTPSIVGRDFSFRDWYRGVSRTGRPYVSRAYVTEATGHERIVAAAVHVRSSGGPVGILVAGYSLHHLQELSEGLAATQGIRLKITDQAGVVVADSAGLPRGLQSHRTDPRVAAALAGRSGVTELETPGGRQLSSYEAVPDLGWTVTTSVPSNTAFAAVSDLRSAVLGIAAVLAVALVIALWLLAKMLRDRRQAEQEAARTAQINEAVLEATTDGIALVDREGCVAVANGTLKRFLADMVGRPVTLGRDGTELRALSQEVASRTTNPAAYLSAIAKVAEDPDYVGLNEFKIAETGRVFVRYVAPVRDAHGGDLGRLIVIREVTAEREAERLKSDLLATVSHELRTPLTGVLGFTELLLRDDPGEETRQRYLTTIYGEAKRLTSLINDFLDLQRIESGSFALALEPFDLAAVLRQGVELFAAQSREHTLELHLGEEPLTVVGEPERIMQVVANLLSNAIKYSPDGGRVDVDVAATNGVVRVSVRDQGLGIPEDQQGAVFDKFFRVDSSATRKIGGTGLGLALAREIVEAHAGRIGFDSVPGEGSEFWFELPAGRRTDGRHGRILVVEDDAATASFLATQLGESGFAVDVVTTGLEVVASAKSDPPDAICLDIQLDGDVDGWEVLGLLKSHAGTAHVPIVVCTGGNGRGRAAALGAADFLTKPFSGEQLLETVSRLLSGRERQVLVVDDSPQVRRLVADTLARAGFETAEAVDGLEALERIGERRPDAIVLDLMMPRLDGFAVLERLQEDDGLRQVPVVVLTAKRLTETERRVLSAQAVALLDKSFYSTKELVGLVAKAAGAAA